MTGESMTMPSTIAIDGPAASGKSTIGALLAERLGYVYFDTGVMYRAVTWVALQRGIPVEDEAAVTRLSERLTMEVTRPTVDDGRQYTVYADGEDVTWDLRGLAVNEYVSPVSAYPGVRRSLVAQQRRIAQQGAIVMVGRDIGTVVLPDADLKIYLDATVDERAWRRYVEVFERRTSRRPERGRDADGEYSSIREALARRDHIDSTRGDSPLRPAEDAVLIDTTNMAIGEVLSHVLALVEARDCPA
jgi:cytidylate kinase